MYCTQHSGHSSAWDHIMVQIKSRPQAFAGAFLMSIALAACGSDGNTAPTGGQTFAAVQATLNADCSTCHASTSGRIFRTDLDSAQLTNSGFINPSDPAQSALLLKPTNVTPHGGGVVASFTAGDRAAIAEWIAAQPASTGAFLNATKLPAGASPPVVDGFFDSAWTLATPTTYMIGGGWADATSVRVTALYDSTYLYMRVSWVDDANSDRRQPWVKQANGSWLVLPAKAPLPTVGNSWAQYMGGHFNEEDPARFAYEDKLAIMWNTYGASTVAGFETGGCAVTCHDPTNSEGPGTTYNYTDQSQAAKKFTNAPGEIADMWHWKLVRNNQHYRMDDQAVRYWVRGVTGSADGGRGSDAGTAGYASNPATNGAPTYRGPTANVPPYYFLATEQVALTPTELSGFPVGKEIANMITSGPTGVRAQVQAYGRYNTGGWVIEIRRNLLTGDVDDVQFDDLTRTYTFGVAVFDNAQIEHSYMSLPGKLVFKP